MNPKPKIVSCPSCDQPVEWTPESRFRPFCSERCKTMDFGAWATESYRVAGPSDGEINLMDLDE